MIQRKIQTVCFVIFLVPCFLLFLIVQEYAVRFVFPQFDPSQQLKFISGNSETPTLGEPNSIHRLLKNSGDYDVTIKFNKHGLRDKNDLARAKGDCALVVGNSYAFGWGIEADQRFSNQLNAILGIGIYNLATTGGLDNIKRLLKYAKSLGAPCKKMILTIWTEAELRKKHKKQPVRKRTNRTTSNSKFDLMTAKSFLVKNSAIYFLLTHIVHGNSWLRDRAVSAGLILELDVASTREPLSMDAVEPLVNEVKNVIRDFDAVVLLVPPVSMWITGKSKKPKTIYKALVNSLEKNEIRVVDPSSVFKKVKNPKERYHFAHDAHWTAAGHKIVSEQLAGTLGSWAN